MIRRPPEKLWVCLALVVCVLIAEICYFTRPLGVDLRWGGLVFVILAMGYAYWLFSLFYSRKPAKTADEYTRTLAVPNVDVLNPAPCACGDAACDVREQIRGFCCI